MNNIMQKYNKTNLHNKKKDTDDDEKDSSAMKESPKSDALPWVEKYRPKKLDEIYGHKQIIRSIKKMVTKGKFQNILFFGPPGTGKTSTIVAAATELYGASKEYMVLELNASADRGIDAVRQKILKFVSTDTVFFNQFGNSKRKLRKLVILDETDAMTADAQDSLRIIMESYIKNARFCLICNYIAKIRDAIQSRCTKLKFTPISDADMRTKIKSVCKLEDIKISDCGIDTIIRRADGDMRVIFNSLQSIKKTDKVLTADYINECLGHPTSDQINEIYDLIENNSLKDSVAGIRKIVRKLGLSVPDIITELHVKVMESKTIKLDRKYTIFDKLANVEIFQAGNTNERIQLVALISCFK